VLQAGKKTCSLDRFDCSRYAEIGKYSTISQDSRNGAAEETRCTVHVGSADRDPPKNAFNVLEGRWGVSPYLVCLTLNNLACVVRCVGVLDQSATSRWLI
jgi:hypothetical protein